MEGGSKPLDHAMIKGIAGWLNHQGAAADPLPYKLAAADELLGREGRMAMNGNLRVEGNTPTNELLADMQY